MKNKQRLAEFLTLMADIHEKDISKAKVEYYWEFLESFTDEQCEMAFKKVGRKWFPKPQDFLDVLHGSNEDRSLVGWQDVMKCLTDGKRSENLDINRTVSALGGWDNLESQSFDELQWTEKRFKEHFEVIEKRQDMLGMVKDLPEPDERDHYCGRPQDRV